MVYMFKTETKNIGVLCRGESLKYLSEISNNFDKRFLVSFQEGAIYKICQFFPDTIFHLSTCCNNVQEKYKNIKINLCE
jgi:hypothetical protein